MTSENDILIVDDEIANLRLLTSLLEKEGYRVRPAESAHLAIDSVLARPPVLILLNVKIPDLDCFEVCRRLKEDKRTHEIPIIFISAQRETEERVRGFDAGAVDFISKPFREQEILARVKTHTHLRKMQQHLDELVSERTAQLDAEISGHREAEEGLMKSQERFRNLMEQSPSPIEILNPEGKIEQVNSAWLQLWDLKDEEAAQVLKKYNMLTDPQIVDLGVASLVKKAFEGEPVVLPPIQYSANRTAEDFGLSLKELRMPWIQCHVYPVKDKQGKVEFVVNTYVDITELRRVEREAREQRETLARVDRATSMGQLTGSIAHELNQPLTGILSNAQAAELLLESGRADDDELKEIVAEIVSDTKRASAVIRNLREVFREHKGEFLPVDINAVVDETTQLLHSEAVIQQVALTTESASATPIVNGNRVQLQQVLVNLIMNGIQAMSGSARERRRLHVATTYDANEVKAWVEDNGPGIEPANIDRIFEPLATWKPGGTGMGLAISNSIVEAHGGRMWAENRPEGGARVGFSLPVQKEDQ